MGFFFFLKSSYCVNILWRHLVALSSYNKQSLLRIESSSSAVLKPFLWGQCSTTRKAHKTLITLNDIYFVLFSVFSFLLSSHYPSLPSFSLLFLPSPASSLLFFVFQEAHSKKSAVSLDDSDIEARLNSWNLGVKKKKKYFMHVYQCRRIVLSLENIWTDSV